MFEKRNGFVSPSSCAIELLLFTHETKWKRSDQFYLCVQHAREFKKQCMLYIVRTRMQLCMRG